MCFTTELVGLNDMKMGATEAGQPKDPHTHILGAGRLFYTEGVVP